MSVATPQPLTTNKIGALCMHTIVSCVSWDKDRHAANRAAFRAHGHEPAQGGRERERERMRLP